MLKRLHDLRAPYPARAYLWYAAMQSRRGMRHLVEVPVMALDVPRLVVPGHLRYSDAGRQSYRNAVVRDHKDIAVPYTIQGDIGLANKWCSRSQAVSHWRHEDSQWIDTRQPQAHGVCDRCWNALGNTALGSTILDIRYAQRIASLGDDQEQWERATALRLYGRA